MASTSPVSRRSFLSKALGVAMAAGLVAAYGTLAAFMARFLYPAKPTTRRWMFVTNIEHLHEGDSLVYHTPAGAPVNITRLGSGGAAGPGGSGRVHPAARATASAAHRAGRHPVIGSPA